MKSKDYHKLQAKVLKPELAIFGFYSQVAAEVGLRIQDVDAIYSHYIKTLSAAVVGSPMTRIPELGCIRPKAPSLRTTFFKATTESMKMITRRQVYPVAEDVRQAQNEKITEFMYVAYRCLHMLIETLEGKNRLNVAAAQWYWCSRNVLGHLYVFIDTLDDVKDPTAEEVKEVFIYLYDTYAPRFKAYLEKGDMKKYAGSLLAKKRARLGEEELLFRNAVSQNQIEEARRWLGDHKDAGEREELYQQAKAIAPQGQIVRREIHPEVFKVPDLYADIYLPNYDISTYID